MLWSINHDVYHAVSRMLCATDILALVDAGADVNEVEGAGNTPLHSAAYEGWAEGVQLLLQLGAKVNASNNAGDTPWHWATNMGHQEVAQLLEQVGLAGEPAQYSLVYIRSIVPCSSLIVCVRASTSCTAFLSALVRTIWWYQCCVALAPWVTSVNACTAASLLPVSVHLCCLLVPYDWVSPQSHGPWMPTEFCDLYLQNGASKQKGPVLVQEHVPKVKVSKGDTEQQEGTVCLNMCVCSGGQQHSTYMCTCVRPVCVGGGGGWGGTFISMTRAS
jgi:hypothetical protein